MIKTIPKKGKARRQSDCLRRPCKSLRKEVKSRRETERYIQLNAEFQRIARRNKKAFLNEQCKEIEENNELGKTRDLFKNIGNIKGIFHSKMGTIKDRNGQDLIDAEEIKKRWKEYTGKLYKKKRSQ